MTVRISHPCEKVSPKLFIVAMLCWDPFEESNIILAQAIKLIVKTTPSSRPATTNLFGYPHGAQLISPIGFRGTDFRSMCIYCAYTIFTLECKRSSSSPSCWRVCIFPSRHLLVLRRNRWVGLCGPFNMYEYRIIELWTMHAQTGSRVFTLRGTISYVASYSNCTNYA